jgi:hypothetical protein
MRRGILATPEELSRLAGRIGSPPFDSFYQRLQARCEAILETPPVSETQWRSLWQQGHWGAATSAAQTCQGRLIDLLIAHAIERNYAFRDRAIEELMNLAGFSTWRDPCHDATPADLATAEAAVGAAVGLDWLWDDLAEEDRETVLAAIREKALAGYQKGLDEGASWSQRCDHWNAVVNGGCGLAAAALADEDEAYRRLADAAVKALGPFFDALGRGGGWDEGLGYWGYALRYVLLLAEARSRLDDDQRLYHRRGMDETGRFPVYFSPHAQAASFGDNPAVPLHGAMYLLCGRLDCSELCWWLDAYSLHHDVTTAGWSQAGLSMLFRPDDVPAEDEIELEPVKVFSQIGWASMADRWPRPQMYLAAKTGELAARGSHHDMNSLQLQLDGEMLLTDLGSGRYSREYFGAGREEHYAVQARAHNTLVMAEGSHRIDARGQILESSHGPSWRYLACDAGEALGEQARFLRHCVMLVDPDSGRGEAVVVLDELTSNTPENFELFWHSRGEIRLNDDGRTGTIRGRRRTMHFALRSTAPNTVRTASHNSDRFCQLAAGVMGRTYFLSLFCRETPPQTVEIKPASSGRLHAHVGRLTLRFESEQHRLRFAAVE